MSNLISDGDLLKYLSQKAAAAYEINFTVTESMDSPTYHVLAYNPQNNLTNSAIIAKAQLAAAKSSGPFIVEVLEILAQQVKAPGLEVKDTHTQAIIHENKPKAGKAQPKLEFNSMEELYAYKGPAPAESPLQTLQIAPPGEVSMLDKMKSFANAYTSQPPLVSSKSMKDAYYKLWSGIQYLPPEIKNKD